MKSTTTKNNKRVLYLSAGPVLDHNVETAGFLGDYIVNIVSSNICIIYTKWHQHSMSTELTNKQYIKYNTIHLLSI